MVQLCSALELWNGFPLICAIPPHPIHTAVPSQVWVLMMVMMEVREDVTDKIVVTGDFCNIAWEFCSATET